MVISGYYRYLFLDSASIDREKNVIHFVIILFLYDLIINTVARTSQNLFSSLLSSKWLFLKDGEKRQFI